MSDPIRQPSHYRSESGIEAIDVIRAWGLSFSLGSALKYLCRAGLKPGQDRRQDLQKALWYVAEELGGKGLANEVAQLVAMELAEGQTQRLPEPVEEEPEATDDAPEVYGVADAAPALADYQPRVTPEVTATTTAPMINSLTTLEEVQPSNHPEPAPIAVQDETPSQPASPAPRAKRVVMPKETVVLADGEITTTDAAKILGKSLSDTSTYLARRKVSPLRPGTNNRPAVWDRAQVEAAATQQMSAAEGIKAARSQRDEQAKAQGWVSSEELSQRSGISVSGLVWNVNHGNLTAATPPLRGRSYWFTPEECDRFIAARAKPSKGRKATPMAAPTVAAVEAPAPAPAPVEEEKPAAPPPSLPEPVQEPKERIPTAPGAAGHKMPTQDDVTRTNGYAMEVAIRRGRAVFVLGGVFTLYMRPAPDSSSGLLDYKPAAPRDDAAMREAGWKPMIRLIRKATGQWDEVPVAAHNGHERNVPVVANSPDRGVPALGNLSNARRVA